MHAMVHSVLTCAMLLLMMESECVGDLGDGSKFQLVTRQQKEQFDPNICWK